jgi:hypothetical protein
MAKRAIMSFQALSLKAPKNWAMRSPRRAWVVVECIGEGVTDSDMAETETECCVVGRRCYHEERGNFSILSVF